MAKHEEMYPLLLMELPGCPHPVVRSALNRAAAELCRRALVWQEALNDTPIVPGVWQYELDVPNGAMVVVIQSVKAGGVELSPLNDTLGRYPWGSVIGQPGRYALLPDCLTVGIDPVPSSPGILKLGVVLAPTLESTELPDIVANRHWECIAEGAKAYLKRMPNKPWSDPNGAGDCHRLFSTKIDEARIETAYGRVNGSLQVAPRRFG